MSEILVVNDDEKTRTITLAHLEKHGLDTTGVFNGKAALEELRQGRIPKVIVSDLNQPEFEGYDLATFLRGEFNVNLLTSTDPLRRRFSPRLDIARRYTTEIPQEILRFRKGIRLILTSAGDQQPLLEQEIQRHKGKPYDKWLIDTAELSYALKALGLKDSFVSLPPIVNESTGRISGVGNLDLLTTTVREQLERYTRCKEQEL